MASVVPFPGLNPNCISSNFTIPLTRASITLSNTFKTYSSSFILLYELHSRAFPFPLYTFTIQLLFQSTGISPLLTTSLQISVTHFTPDSPAAFNISATTPDGPAAFHSLPWISLLSLQQLILLFPLPMFLPYLFPQYYLYSTQIPHLTIAHNILSISALSSLPPLSFSHPLLHTSTCRNVLVQPNHLLSDSEYITLAILFH